MAESARYLYAISRSLAGDALADVRGIRGAPVAVVRHEGLDAVVGDVPLEEFGEDGLRTHLEDLAWLEEVARGHDDVVRAVAELGPTAPLRLATICLDDDGVRRRLEESRGSLVSVLDRVAGRAEWSVKLVAPSAAAEPAAEEDRPTSGAEFLRRKKARSDQRQEQHLGATGAAEEVHRELAAVAVASRVLPPQDPQLTGIAGTMVLNGAYLVDLAAGDDFAVRFRELAAAHPTLQAESAGPWPPYSFAVLEEP